ncbi:hypothetical protein DY000_02059800 [Brassica cretica]|uniref:Uncharacterized protein n=1 Tax=Brassica cretica TaxID=69181 RepID=A0ABQ7AVX6_BRACR|nr:hypothetical protein DY000_02059800 [Brassica cretica]
MSKARADLVSLVHAQQYQKQQGNSTAFLTRSCKFGPFIPQRSTLLIDRQQQLCVARFRSTIIDLDTSPVDRYSLTTVDRRHSSSIDRHLPSQTSIDTEPRDMVATFILVRDDKGDLHDQEGHLRNAAVVKEEKLQEGDFEVESLMSFGGSHWCRSTPDYEHRSTDPSPNRSTDTSPNRSTGSPEHRSMTPTESTASCNAIKILTHEEFAAKHPHPPSPV